MSGIKSFEDLECWKACTEVRRYVNSIVKTFPSDEKFGLASDMRRAGRSTTHNIAEGYGRFHYKENTRFCRISRGSLYELLDQFITAQDEGLINNEQYLEGRRLITKALPLLNGYINYLSKADTEKK